MEETRSYLIRALGGGERDRNRLLERLRPRVVLWAATHLSAALRARVEPEDVAQEVLLAVHRGLDAFEGDDDRAFMAWVFRIAANRIRDLADHFGAQKRQAVDRPANTQTSPSAHALRRESSARVVAALADLPEDYRAVIRLRRLEEMDVPRVASVMGRSENAVRVLYCRAIQALRERLDVPDET